MRRQMFPAGNERPPGDDDDSRCRTKPRRETAATKKEHRGDGESLTNTLFIVFRMPTRL